MPPWGMGALWLNENREDGEGAGANEESLKQGSTGGRGQCRPVLPMPSLRLHELLLVGGAAGIPRPGGFPGLFEARSTATGKHIATITLRVRRLVYESEVLSRVIQGRGNRGCEWRRRCLHLLLALRRRCKLDRGLRGWSRARLLGQWRPVGHARCHATSPAGCLSCKATHLRAKGGNGVYLEGLPSPWGARLNNQHVGNFQSPYPNRLTEVLQAFAEKGPN